MNRQVIILFAVVLGTLLFGTFVGAMVFGNRSSPFDGSFFSVPAEESAISENASEQIATETVVEEYVDDSEANEFIIRQDGEKTTLKRLSELYINNPNRFLNETKNSIFEFSAKIREIPQIDAGMREMMKSRGFILPLSSIGQMHLMAWVENFNESDIVKLNRGDFVKLSCNKIEMQTSTSFIFYGCSRNP